MSDRGGKGQAGHTLLQFERSLHVVNRRWADCTTMRMTGKQLAGGAG